MKVDKQLVDNEALLIERCVAWDRIAQNTLYKWYAATMFAVCIRYAKNREEAQDILQDGFIKVFENIKSFRSEGSLEGWIRRIIVNTAIKKYRENKLKGFSIVRIDESREDLNHHNADETISRIGAKELIGLIQKLPPGYQMVFNLYVFEGMKHREIAEHLNISEGTSKSNLSDARKILQAAVLSNSVIKNNSVEHGR